MSRAQSYSHVLASFVAEAARDTPHRTEGLSLAT